MLSNKLITVVIRSHIPCYFSLRYLRGGYTIEVKKPKRNVKLSEEENRLRRHKLEYSNVGAGRALHAIQERDGYLDPDLTEDDLERTSDVSNIHSEFQEKIKSAYGDFDRKSLNNIKRQHFKEPKLPNMVPYCEKQDMKFLHENDPENWDVEKLSESFPVTPEIAKKILRSPFTAYTVQAIKAHDRTVKRNWERFKEGKLDLSPELRNHYAKFVDRVSFETSENVIKKYLPPPPNFEIKLKYKEFGSIIEKYEQTKPTKIQTNEENKMILEDMKAQPTVITEDDLYSRGIGVTLDDLRKKIKRNPQQASELSKLMVETEKKYLPTSKTKPNIEMVTETDYLANAQVVDTAYQNSLPSQDDDFPLQIRIPKKQWKLNKIYQVKDRFYNDRGQFLYRVPGLFS